MSDASAILTEGDYNIESIMDSLNDIPYNSFDAELGECCSVYVRLNQTDYVLSQRRDGGANFLLHVDKNKNYVKEFRSLGEYYFLSKVYSNGWVIGTGGWDDAAHNEKVEAIASDMALNECITMEALELIVDVKKINGVGHLLIVAPDGRWGNIITYSGRTYIGTGVLNDGEYIVSPNDPNYRQEGNLSYIGDVVEENINLSARDTYGYDRHCILAHHVVLSDFGIEDEVYVSNEDGRFINQSNAGCCDEFWFGEEYVSNYEIPIALDRLHLGTYYFSNRSIVSQNATVGYNGDYLFKVQLFDNNGDFLAYKQINVTVNGKANEYVTNKEGIIKIPFDKLTSSKNISLRNPATGEWEVNSITVVSRIVGSNVVMDYFDGSKYTVKVYDSNGKPAGEGKTVTLKLNNKKYKIKTNSKGVASLTIPKTAIPKTYTLTATYGGQTIKNTVKIKQILKSADKTVKKSSKKAILKATLKTSKNKAIKGKWISFKFKGKTYKAKTNYKGIAKVTLNKKIINTLKAGKSYVLTVAYLKDNVKSTVKVRR